MATTNSTTTKKAPARPKKTETETPVNQATPVATKATASTVEAENSALKAQLEELKTQMLMMQQMMMQNTTPQATRKIDRMIRFINLVPGTLVLRGSVIWKIEGQFAFHDFLESEATVIVSNMANLVREGAVYIADAQFVEEHNLADVYRYILTDDQMRELLDKDSKYVVDAYKMANDTQKQIIIDMITEKKLAGGNIDANILFEIGRLSGQNLLELNDEEEDNQGG
jgi:hypothetical protein